MNGADREYAQTLARLQALGRFGVRMGLERVTAALEALGQPHHRFATVHVAGTNGKGSTAAMLESCLRASDVRTGLFTSPHLCRFTERVRLDGREVSRRDVVRLAAEALGQEGLTFFEVVTVMALTHFARSKVDLAVVEAGMGGRLDATNVVRPEVCVLTHIGLDHTEVLGPDLESVARDKAGIIKPGVPLVSAPAPTPEVGEIVRRRCEEVGAPLLVLGRDFHLESSGGAMAFGMGQWRLEGLIAGLHGEHQRQNAALCMAAVGCLRQGGRAIPGDMIRRGLAGVRWPGRMEWIDEDHLLDGAHNPDGAEALARSLEETGKRFCLVFGALEPGPTRPVVEALLPYADRIIFTRPQSPRAVDPISLAAAFPGSEVAPDLAAALDLNTGDPRPRLVTGSLYLVGEARALLAGDRVDPVVTADPR